MKKMIIFNAVMLIAASFSLAYFVMLAKNLERKLDTVAIKSSGVVSQAEGMAIAISSDVLVFARKIGRVLWMIQLVSCASNIYMFYVYAKNRTDGERFGDVIK